MSYLNPTAPFHPFFSSSPLPYLLSSLPLPPHRVCSNSIIPPHLPPPDGKSVHHGDSWELMQRRWSKLEKDFKTKKGQYDISKIPDIYDCIKYDLQHNHHQVLFEHSEELYKCSKYLADVVIPQVGRGRWRCVFEFSEELYKCSKCLADVFID